MLAGPTFVHPVKRVGIGVHDQLRENTWVFSEGTDKLNFTAFSIHNVLRMFFCVRANRSPRSIVSRQGCHMIAKIRWYEHFKSINATGRCSSALGALGENGCATGPTFFGAASYCS